MEPSEDSVSTQCKLTHSDSSSPLPIPGLTCKFYLTVSLRSLVSFCQNICFDLTSHPPRMYRGLEMLLEWACVCSKQNWSPRPRKESGKNGGWADNWSPPLRKSREEREGRDPPAGYEETKESLGLVGFREDQWLPRTQHC